VARKTPINTPKTVFRIRFRRTRAHLGCEITSGTGCIVFRFRERSDGRVESERVREVREVSERSDYPAGDVRVVRGSRTCVCRSRTRTGTKRAEHETAVRAAPVGIITSLTVVRKGRPKRVGHVVSCERFPCLNSSRARADFSRGRDAALGDDGVSDASIENRKANGVADRFRERSRRSDRNCGRESFVGLFFGFFYSVRP